MLTLNEAGDKLVGTDRATAAMQVLVDEATAARDTAAQHLSDADDALEDAEDARDAAQLAAQNAEGVLTGFPIGSALNNMAGKLLRVNDAGTGYELIASVGAFYGFKVTSECVLQYNSGTENIAAADFATSMFAPVGMTFSINSNGHLVATA